MGKAISQSALITVEFFLFKRVDQFNGRQGSWPGGLVKIIVEIAIGQSLLTQTAWPSVPAVHAVGFLSGLAYAHYSCGGRNLIVKTPVLMDPGCENKGGRVYKRSDSEDGAMPHHLHLRNGEIDDA